MRWECANKFQSGYLQLPALRREVCDKQFRAPLRITSEFFELGGSGALRLADANAPTVVTLENELSLGYRVRFEFRLSGKLIVHLNIIDKLRASASSHKNGIVVDGQKQFTVDTEKTGNTLEKEIRLHFDKGHEIHAQLSIIVQDDQEKKIYQFNEPVQINCKMQ